MTVAELETVPSYPAQETIYQKYEYEEHGLGGDPARGPYLTVYFESSADLRSIARNRGAYLLGYSAFQCPKSAPHKYSFLIGTVFQTTPPERSRVDVPSSSNLYKIYIPAKLWEVINDSPFLHTPEERALVTNEISANGLCIKVHGGNAMGTGLRSSTLKLPVAIVDDPLRIKEPTPAADRE